ncbi:MAG: hypothetical protein ABFS41_07695, partial [Myxococcota bacterium]
RERAERRDAPLLRAVRLHEGQDDGKTGEEEPLLRLVDEGRVTARSARELLPELLAQGGDPEALVRERGLEAVSDTGALEGWVDEALAANPKAVEAYAAGDAKSLNFLMGQVMRRSSGKADPKAVRELLSRRLAASK